MNDYVNFSNARDQHEQRWLVRSSVQRHSFRRYHLICFAVLHIPLGARPTLVSAGEMEPKASSSCCRLRLRFCSGQPPILRIIMPHIFILDRFRAFRGHVVLFVYLATSGADLACHLRMGRPPRTRSISRRRSVVFWGEECFGNRFRRRRQRSSSFKRSFRLFLLSRRWSRSGNQNRQAEILPRR